MLLGSNRVFGFAACFLPLWLTSCRGHRPVEVPVRVNAATVYEHMLSDDVPLRLPESEWAMGNQSTACGGFQDYLPYELTVSSSGEVESARLVEYGGWCNNNPLPRTPPPFVMAHIREADALVRAMRFRPWIVAGRPAAVVVRTSLGIAPPERYGASVPFPEHVDPATVFIGLQRRGCEGECPVYSVMLRGDGGVIFQGGGYVAVPGHHTAQVSPAVVEALLARFREANFLAAAPEYTAAFDGGDSLIRLTLNGKTYQVEDQSGMGAGIPTKVRALERAIDAAAEVDRWVGGNGDKLAPLEAEHWDFGAGSRDNLRLYDQAIWRKDGALLERFLAARAPVLANPSAGEPSWSNPDPPPIVAASGMGDVALVQRMLATVNGPVPAPIIFHCLLAGFGSGQVAMVNFWLDRGADPHMKPVALDGKPMPPSDGVDPLRRAIVSGNAEVVSRALGLGFDANGRIGSSGRPLEYAFRSVRPRDFNPKVIELLLKAGADPNERDVIGDTPLFETHNVEVLQMLIAAGAKPNLRDRDGATALYMHADDADALRVLLAAGADPTLRSKDGRTILDAIAEDGGCRLCEDEVSVALRNRGVDPKGFHKVNRH